MRFLGCTRAEWACVALIGILTSTMLPILDGRTPATARAATSIPANAQVTVKQLYVSPPGNWQWAGYTAEQLRDRKARGYDVPDGIIQGREHRELLDAIKVIARDSPIGRLPWRLEQRSTP